MLNVGDIIDVEVQSVREFGIFCRFGNDTIVVLIPDVSWIASFNSCEQFAVVGDVLTVKVQLVNHEKGAIGASIKGLNPNPWEADQLRPGDEHEVRVVRIVANADRCQGNPGYLIELLPGAFAMLCANDSALEVGQQCTVSIIRVDQHRHAVTVALKHDWHRLGD